MVVVPGFPWNLCTKLTETLRQIKTTFPMNLEREVAHGRAVKKSQFMRRCVSQNKVILCIWNAKLRTVGP